MVPTLSWLASTSACKRPFLGVLLLSVALLAASRVAASSVVASPGQLRAAALKQVLTSARGEDAFLRANAQEAIQYAPAEAPGVVELGLRDGQAVVRFAALVTAGRLGMDDAIPGARRQFKDPSASVRAAALFLLRRCGRPADLTPLTMMLTGQDPSERANAAMLLGLLGDRSAVPMLRELARSRMPLVNAAREELVRIQIAEALVRLGDEEALAALRSGAYSQFDEVRVLAVSIMGRVGDRRMEKAFASLMGDPPVELQLAAAESLARFDRYEGLGVALRAVEAEAVTIRAQAAYTLGLFPQAHARIALEHLLNDPAEQVRLSAAAAVLASTPGGPAP